MLIRALLACAFVAVGAPSAAAAAPSEMPALEGETGRLLLAAKKKKKKAPSKDEDDFGPIGIGDDDDRECSSSVHREQEGFDTPYKAEVAGATSLSLLTSEAKDAEPASTTLVDINGHLLLLLGRFGLGPDIGVKYSTQSQKVKDAATGESETVQTMTKNIRFGLLGKRYFGDINRALNVPFVTVGAAYQMLETKAAKSDAIKGWGQVLRAGAGIDMFLDSNIAFSPQLDYTVDVQKAKATPLAETTTTTTSGIRALIELATFL